jgi:hypothetical protein
VNSQALLISTDDGIGDSICALPLVAPLSRRFDFLFLAFRRPDVLNLIEPPANVLPLWRVPAGVRDMRLIALNAPASQASGKRFHPTQHFCLLAGLPLVDPVIPPPVIVATHGLPAYDFLIAPFTNDPGSREWPLDRYPTLFAALRVAYPRSTIAILGADSDPRPWPDACGQTPTAATVHYEYGRKLTEIIAMMRLTTKAVITVDSAGNRLAWLAGIRNHVLLCADCVPLAWGAYPGAHTIYGDIKSIEVDRVLLAVAQGAEERAGESTCTFRDDGRGLRGDGTRGSVAPAAGSDSGSH